MIAEHLPGERTVMVRNPDYWEEGKPYLDGIVILNIPEAATQAEALKNGEVNLVYALESPQSVPGIEAHPDTTVLEGSSLSWIGLPMDMRGTGSRRSTTSWSGRPFKPLRTGKPSGKRHCWAWAASPTTTPYTPATPVSHRSTDPRTTTRNWRGPCFGMPGTRTGRALLEPAARPGTGLSGAGHIRNYCGYGYHRRLHHPLRPHQPQRILLGLSIVLSSADPPRRRGRRPADIRLHTADVGPGMLEMAAAFKESAAPAGIRVDIERHPSDGFWDSVWRQELFTVTWWRGRVNPDSALSIQIHSSSDFNAPRYNNQVLDTEIVRARGQSLEDQEWTYAEIQRILIDDVPRL